jgi:ADP-ribose pyrophosphatase
MTDRAWETLSRRTAYSCEGFDIVNERVALPDGERAEFDYLAEGESVVILPFTPAEEVVVIDEWRHAVKRDNRGLPAGSVEDGEAPRAAVDRELREETGYETGDVDHLCSLEPANGFADAYFHYFVAHDCTPAGEQSLDVDETIDVTTMAFEDLLAAIRDDEFEDGRAATGVLYYALFER